MHKINFNKLEKVLKNLSVKKGDNIYLGIDLFKIADFLKVKKINRYKFVEELLNFFLSKLGKKGNLIIPVFNFECVKKKEFNQKESIGQSGALGSLLLKKYYQHRTYHPFYSFLCFGRKRKIYTKIKNVNATGKYSLWYYFIKDNFDLVTLGHHFSRSFTHIHYLENLKNINYRFNKKFTLKYTDKNNKIKRESFSFFARKKNICEFSGITKSFDKYIFKNKFLKFFKYEKLISFKLNIKKCSSIISEDLLKEKPDFVSFIKKNKKNIDIISDKNINNLEKKYLKKIKNNCRLIN